MAHILTLEIGEGTTKDCGECPFSNIDSDEWTLCGLPDFFPNCNEVDYTKMEVKDSDIV